MRLKARLKRLEAEVGWLGTWGLLRSGELQLELYDLKKQVADYLADHPEKAAYCAAIGMSVRPTPRPPPREPPRAVASAGSASLPRRPDDPVNDNAAVARDQARSPSPGPAAVPAETAPETAPGPAPKPAPSCDIPELMQIRPIRWVPPGERYFPADPHTPEDDDYDPFADFSDSS
jgi:hypothetical protein